MGKVTIELDKKELLILRDALFYADVTWYRKDEVDNLYDKISLVFTKLTERS